MAQMTAVEWFMSQIIDGEIDPATNAIFLKRHINKVEVLEKAKQMEKDQAIYFADEVSFAKLNEDIYCPISTIDIYNKLYEFKPL